MKEKNRSDPFRGNIISGWAVFILLVLAIIVTIAMLIFCVWKSVGPPKTSDDCLFINVNLKSYHTDNKGNLYLVDSNGNEYKIEHYRDYGTMNDLKTAFNVATEYEIHYKYTTPIIYNLVSEKGEVLVSFEKEREIYRAHNSVAWISLAVFFAFVACYIIMVIYVGRHPEKCSPKIRKIFWKNWAWR